MESTGFYVATRVYLNDRGIVTSRTFVGNDEQIKERALKRQDDEYPRSMSVGVVLVGDVFLNAMTSIEGRAKHNEEVMKAMKFISDSFVELEGGYEECGPHAYAHHIWGTWPH